MYLYLCFWGDDYSSHFLQLMTWCYNVQCINSVSLWSSFIIKTTLLPTKFSCWPKVPISPFLSLSIIIAVTLKLTPNPFDWESESLESFSSSLPLKCLKLVVVVERSMIQIFHGSSNLYCAEDILSRILLPKGNAVFFLINISAETHSKQQFLDSWTSV